MTTGTTVSSGLSSCIKCRSGDKSIIRLIVRATVTGAKYWIHIHENEDLTTLLSRLCTLFPEEWLPNTNYHVYIDTGGLYHSVENAFWLRDKDHILVATYPNVSEIPDIDLNAIHASLQDNINLKSHQVKGVNQIIEMEQRYRGGILGDEMGLGKTLQILELTIRQQPRLNLRAKTLIVVPSHGVADHWTNEIRTKSNYGSLPYFVYGDDTVELIDQTCFKVVITTYDRIRSEYKRQQTLKLPSPLLATHWFRVVLDESNKLRNLKTLLCRAILDLQTTYKWCLTGTPIQNDVSELFPTFKFLGIEVPTDKRLDLEYLSEVLNEHMIRRKKQELKDELKISKLKVKRILLNFSEPERALYDYLEQILYKQLKHWQKSQDFSEVALKSALLYLRLKQACAHHQLLIQKFPDLIPNARKYSETDVANILNSQPRHWTGEKGSGNNSELREVCGIIKDFYDQCESEVNTQPNMDELLKLPYISYSTKMSWLIEFLKKKLHEKPDEKIVVVSQFVDFLVLISKVLHSLKIEHVSYNGDMSIPARKFSLERFNYNPSYQVLLLSLKAGGIGLNLQRANHMVLMDRWWNPATMGKHIFKCFIYY
ncbi:unnamed protein product [Cunninghamella echinulata]